MKTINPVFDIFLPTSIYNTSGTSYESYIADSANHRKLAVFSAEDNTSLASTDTAKAENGFYLAMPIWKDGELYKVRKTKATIFPQQLQEFVSKCATAWQQQVFLLDNYKLEFDEVYIVKFKLKNKWFFQDYNIDGLTKMFDYHTEKQIGTATCPDYGKFAASIWKQVNSDRDGYIKCKAFYYDSGTLSEVELTDEAAILSWSQSNPCQPIKLRFYINRLPVSTTVEYNLLENREIVAEMSVSGLGVDNTNITEEQELIFENVPGTVIKALEYEEGGWEGNPEYYRYRQSNFIGYKPWDSFADVNATYSLLSIVYNNEYPQTVQIENKGQLVVYVASDDVTVYNDAKNLLATLLGVTAPSDCA